MRALLGALDVLVRWNGTAKGLDLLVHWGGDGSGNGNIIGLAESQHFSEAFPPATTAVQARAGRNT